MHRDEVQALRDAVRRGAIRQETMDWWIRYQRSRSAERTVADPLWSGFKAPSRYEIQPRRVGDRDAAFLRSLGIRWD